MGLIAYAYDTPEGIENRLSFWLSMDEWGIAEATQIIADIDPDQSIKSGAKGNVIFQSVKLFTGHQVPEETDEDSHDDRFDGCICNDHSCAHCEANGELFAYARKCKDISRLLNKRSENLTYASPKVWIDRALAKKIEIPWIEWAKKSGLLPVGLAENVVPMKQANTTEDKPLSTKERDTFLIIIAALCGDSVITPADRGSASLIAKLTEGIGAPVTDDTIRKVLAKIPDALERRKK